MLKAVSIFKISFLVLILILGCRKEGCKDMNSANFDKDARINDGICTYRYLSRVQVTKMRFDKEGAIAWDSNDDVEQNNVDNNPDLRFYLKRTGSQNWETITDLKSECCYSLPVSWQIEYGKQPFLETNTKYEYKLVDEDYSGDDLILQGSFVPYWDYNSESKSITLSNTFETVKIELFYEVF